MAERKAAYDAAYTKFSTQVPVTLLKLRSRIEPRYYKEVVKSFELGVQSNVELIRAQMTRRYRDQKSSIGGGPVTMGDPGDNPDRTFGFLQTTKVCSDAVIDFTYAAAADSSSLDDTKNDLLQACRWSRSTWTKLVEPGGPLPNR